MKTFTPIFFKFLLPIFVIIVVAFTFYFVQRSRNPMYTFEKSSDKRASDIRAVSQKNIDDVKEITNQRVSDVKQEAENRIMDTKEFSKERLLDAKNSYDIMLAEVKDEKIIIYIIMVSTFLIFTVLFLNLIRILTKLNSDMIINPDGYEVITEEESKVLDFLKHEMVRRKLIESNQKIKIEDCSQLLTN